MTRPKLPRNINFKAGVSYFKPQGVPLRILEEITLLPDEVQALKLYQIDSLDQKKSAEKMHISQPTFARILASAQKKTAKAIINGLAIRIENS